MLVLPGIVVFTAVIAFLHSFYFMFLFVRVAFFKRKENRKSLEQPPVTVVICAKNEKYNLKHNLENILKQDYPAFEVVVVDDYSIDGTDEFLMDLKPQFKHLHVTRITGEEHALRGKKFAITLGVKAARYKYIIVTDADCTPSGIHWLAEMMQAYTPGKEIVLGYAPYEKEKGLLNKIIRFETVYGAMQYLGYALSGIPYMGVGRNMSYTRDLFFKNAQVFVKHPNLLSGDDDLLINAAATSKNTAIQISQGTFMTSPAKLTWEEWRYQKRRHLSTAKHYKPMHKFLLGSFSILHVLFYLALVASLINSQAYLLIVSIWAARLLVNGLIIYLVMRKLKETDLIWLYPFFDLAFLIYYLIFTPAALTRKKVTKWK